MEKSPTTRPKRVLDQEDVQPQVLVPFSPEKTYRKSALHVVLILILGLLIYSNTFHVPFQWDEEKFIIKNPLIKDFSYFTDPLKARGHELFRALKNRYIGYLTFAINYKMNGFNVLGYHVVNTTIHLLNALLVYFFVILLFRTPLLKGSGLSTHSRPIALFSSLLFVAHPVQTEAVTYIFQRLASLVTLFYLLSIVTYIKSRLSEKTSRRYFFYGLSLISAILAMKTKENAFTLPVAIALCEFLFLKGTLKERFSSLIPLALILLIIPLTLLRSGTQAIPEIGYQEIPRRFYLLTQFRVVITYIRLLIVPINQNLDYDYPLYKSFFDAPVLLSFIFILTTLCFSAYLIYRSRTDGRESRLIGFGILWFFLTLFVESSIIPIPMLIDEYRVYLPSVGFFIAVTAWGFQIIRRFETKRIKRMTVSAAIGIVLIFSYATYIRNSLWKDKAILWGDVIRKSPNKANGYINRGLALKEKGLHQDAVRDFEKGLSLEPNHVLAHHNLAVLYLGMNRLDDAMRETQSALKIAPDLAEAHLLLGMILGKKGKSDEGISQFQVGARLAAKRGDVNTPEYHSELATLYYHKGRFDDAMKELQAALRLKPDLTEAHKNLAVLYMKKNRFDEAVKELKTTISLKPDFAEAYNDLGSLYLTAGRLEDAIREIQVALRLKPDLADGHKNLASIYIKRNRLDEAAKELETAIKLKPDFAAAHNDLGYVYALQGRMKDAALHFEEAVRLGPDNPEFLRNLQQTNLKNQKDTKPK